MILSDISVRRPVFAWMLMAGLIVFGAISFNRLGVSQMPDVDFPILEVRATWEGAAPEILEAELVDKIEQAVISVEGLKEVRSTIRQGQASVELEFELSRDLDAALQEVQAQMSQVRLPLNVEPPTIPRTAPRASRSCASACRAGSRCASWSSSWTRRCSTSSRSSRAWARSA